MKKAELTGALIKNVTGARRACMRWHNKNKSYSNFGFNVYMFEGFTRNIDFEITGDYNAQTGEIVCLRAGPLYGCSHKIPTDMFKDVDTFKEWLNEYTHIRLNKNIEV